MLTVREKFNVAVRYKAMAPRRGSKYHLPSFRVGVAVDVVHEHGSAERGPLHIAIKRPPIVEEVPALTGGAEYAPALAYALIGKLHYFGHKLNIKIDIHCAVEFNFC